MLTFFQEWRKQRQDKKASNEEDIIKVISINDYIKDLQKSLPLAQSQWPPCHIILPFLKQIEFIDYNDKKLAEIRELYNLISLKLHSMEKFLDIQGDPRRLGDVGREVISRKHWELREEVLKYMNILKEKIDNFLKERVRHGKK